VYTYTIGIFVIKFGSSERYSIILHKFYRIYKVLGTVSKRRKLKLCL